MPVDIEQFGPLGVSGNTQTVLGAFQTQGLANPADTELQAIQASLNLANYSAKTDFTSGEAQTYSTLASATPMLALNPAPAGDPTSIPQDSSFAPYSLDSWSDGIPPTQALLDSSTPELTKPDIRSEAQATATEPSPMKRDANLLKPSSYNLPRINWELTTVLREELGGEPLRFFVNPLTVRYQQEFVSADDLVQKGYFLTQWKDPNADNYFPALKLSFLFQSSNILPETYSGKATPKTSSKFDRETGTSMVAYSSKEYRMPPGLENFFDIISVFHESRLIDGQQFLEASGGSDDPNLVELADKLNGAPNYCKLSISTRVFPRMTLYGFFTVGLEFGEDAMDPLKITQALNFIALRSDPNWWDAEAIKARYNEFYNSLRTEAKAAIEDIQKPPVNTDQVKLEDIQSSVLNAAGDNVAADPSKYTPAIPGIPEAEEAVSPNAFVSDAEFEAMVQGELPDLAGTKSFYSSDTGATVQTLATPDGNYSKVQQSDGSSLFTKENSNLTYNAALAAISAQQSKLDITASNGSISDITSMIVPNSVSQSPWNGARHGVGF